MSPSARLPRPVRTAAPVPRRARTTPAGSLAGAALMALAAAGATAAAPPGPVGLQQEVSFEAYTPLADTTEILRRLMSPLGALEVQRSLTRNRERLIEHSVDLSHEQFALYVPSRAPPGGYALLVFVPPWEQARLPDGWERVLEQLAVIGVSAARSGNDEDALGRRVPLALLAAHNVMQRYPIDPARVYVGGFSGGSRIALRVALAYPDLFHGALLNAGSDPLDGAPPVLPPRELFRRFQESSRLVYVTGERDITRLAMDAASLASARHWCVFDVESQTIPGAGHAPADAAVLTGALHALLGPPAAPARRLDACRADTDARLKAGLNKAAALLSAGRRQEAQMLLTDIDRHFGGLAAPRSVELQSQLGR